MKLLKKNLSALSFMFIYSAMSCTSSAFAADTKDALFVELGGKAGLTKIVDDFMPLVMADTRINRFFEKTDQVKLKAMLVDQFCELTGGPCQYKGRDMYEAHDGMGVRKVHFNALAEDLQLAMEKNNVPSSVANQLVAKLAPMQRPITSH